MNKDDTCFVIFAGLSIIWRPHGVMDLLLNVTDVCKWHWADVVDAYI